MFISRKRYEAMEKRIDDLYDKERNSYWELKRMITRIHDYLGVVEVESIKQLVPVKDESE